MSQPNMKRKQSTDFQDFICPSKRLRASSLIQDPSRFSPMPRVYNTNTIATRDHDGPEAPEPLISTFRDSGDARTHTMFHSNTSSKWPPPLLTQDNHTIANNDNTFRASPHRSVLQDENSAVTGRENPPPTETSIAWMVRRSITASSTNQHALSSGPPQPSTSQSDRKALHNEDRAISKLAPSALRASFVRNPYAPHTFPSQPSIAQFPGQEDTFQRAQEVNSTLTRSHHEIKHHANTANGARAFDVQDQHAIPDFPSAPFLGSISRPAPTSSAPETPIHGSYQTGHTLAEVCNASHSYWPYVTAPSEPPVAQLPMRSSMFQSILGNPSATEGSARHNVANEARSALSTLETSIYGPSHSRRTLTEGAHASHSHRLHAIPTEPPVAQLPMQNGMFQSAHQKVDISGNARLMNIARDNVINNWHDNICGLEKMEHFVSFSAQFDSSAQDPERVCHPGTRQNVLKQIQDWIDNPKSTERIFWLHGPAGAGKSAIAQTIAQLCGRPKVAATFFFYRSDPSRNDGNKLFTTLAYQLALSIPAIKDHIAQFLRKYPDLPTKSVEKQFNDLIARPFQSMAMAASDQSSPASIIDVDQCEQLAPVIVIDGVDECTDEKLQQRFLKIIGNAVKDPSFPFRFLICSRPEAHIEDALKESKASTLLADLARLDDANRDIEKYLVDQFSRIAAKQNLSPAWPGQEVIQDIVYKSSGNFIFASVVIKFVGDEDSDAEDQLDIIRKLKPPGKMTPFAILDELYLEILRRQPDQDFVKTFLSLLVGRTALQEHKDSNLHEDDALLMKVSKKVLSIKLRKMRSLLKFQPYIDVYHRSFLDFLNEQSRSGDYYVREQGGKRRYMELVVDSIARYVSGMIENPNNHRNRHLRLQFKSYIDNPRYISIHIEELQDMLQPLVQIQDETLKMANSYFANDLMFCDKCNVFGIIRTVLLRLAIRRCIGAISNEVEQPVTEEKCSASVMPPIPTKTIESTLEDNLDSSLSSLLTRLRETKLELTPSTVIVNHTYSILRFDSAETAMKIQSMSDAQMLVDLLVHLIDEQCILTQYRADAMSKTVQLVLNIFARIPVLPQLLFLNMKKTTLADDLFSSQRRCQAALIYRVLNQNYIHFEIKLVNNRFEINSDWEKSGPWKQISTLGFNAVIEVVLQVARIIQYLHSLGIVLEPTFDIRDVYLDASFCPKLFAWCLKPINFFMTTARERASYCKQDVLCFGFFFYQVCFGLKPSSSCSDQQKYNMVTNRIKWPKGLKNVRQLIMRCCTEDPSCRPIIDDIVNEMEMWRIG